MEEQNIILKKKKKWYKKKKIIIPAILVLLLIILFFYFGKDKNAPSYETYKVTRGDLVQTVDATGNVESADEIDLRFESVGKVARIYKNTNDQVKQDDLIMELENGDMSARLAQANATLLKAEANLKKVLSGETNSYIEQLEAKYTQAEANLQQVKAATSDEIANAEAILATAENNLKLAEGGEDSIIVKNAYEDLTAQIQLAQDSVSNALFKADNILGVDNDLANDSFEDYLSSMDKSKLLVAENKYRQAKIARDDIDEKVSAILFSPFDYEKINSFSSDILADLTIVKDMLVAVSQMLNSTVAIGNLSQTELDSMKTGIQSVRTDLSSNNVSLINYVQAISDAKNSYESYKIAYEKAKSNLINIKSKALADVAAYEALVSQSLASYTDAKNPAREEDVLSAEAGVSEAKAGVSQAVASLNKTKLFAPIDGILGKINVKAGEYSSASDIAAKIINPHFEIKVDVPETDIIKIKIGDSAQINLDAYGDDVVFSGKVLEIEQGQTVIQDVIYYNVTLSLEEKQDFSYNIFNGMTADVIFYTEKKENTLFIPQRVILSDENNQKYARVLNNEKQIINKNLITGMKGDDGFIEIVEGLAEGDEVIIRTM
ncbi:MAG: HlyD family efflux transporter periplasmic adaptor subunit [Patescibacteria group bacterium]